MRYLSTGGRWVSTETPTIPAQASSERLVDLGLLHPSMLGLQQTVPPTGSDPDLAHDLLSQGIPPFGGLVRLTDGPGGEPRWASHYDVMMTNPWGHGTIHTIARGLARLPLKLYKPDMDAEPGTVSQVINPDRKTTAGKIAWALRYPNVRPDSETKETNSPPSRRALLYSTVVNKLIHGNALWGIERDRSGIIGFTFYPMEQVEMDEDNLVYKIHKSQYGYPILGLDLRGTGREPEQVLTPDKVCHFGLWEGGRRPQNPSPVRALHATIALYDAVARHMVAFFNNGARVSGNLKIEPGTSGKSRELIRNEILKLYTGPQNAGKVLVTDGDWQAFHREPEFDGIVNLLKYSRDEIFVTYGVPPPVMGVIERAIMSNVREMRDQYVRDLIGPHAEFLAGDFEAQVVDRIDSLRREQIFAEFDVDEQLRPDLWKRASMFRNILLAYTPDELRRIERQPAIAGTDADPKEYAGTIQRPLNESPLTNLPDYTRRDDQADRRLDIEEMRAKHEVEHGSGNEPHINDPSKPDEVAPEEPPVPDGQSEPSEPDEEDD